ncbi:MAG: hypothetical protein AAB656_01650 [Patescibacteria group bacterium]
MHWVVLEKVVVAMGEMEVELGLREALLYIRRNARYLPVLWILMTIRHLAFFLMKEKHLPTKEKLDIEALKKRVVISNRPNVYSKEIDRLREISAKAIMSEVFNNN